MSMSDVVAIVLSTSALVLSMLLLVRFIVQSHASNELQHERMQQYSNAFPRIAGLFLEPDIQHLPPAARTLKIHEIVAQTALMSGPRLEELLLKYMETLDRFHDALAKPESGDVERLHTEISGLAIEIRREMRREIGLDDRATSNRSDTR
jgi:hypothetical protein